MGRAGAADQNTARYPGADHLCRHHVQHQQEFLSIVVRIGKWGTYFGQSGVRISTISRLVCIYVRIGM